MIVLREAGEVLAGWWARLTGTPCDRHDGGLDLPDLPEWDEALADPGSGVWYLAPPCGYDSWRLYPPGTTLDEEGFNSGPPVAKFDAIDGPGRDRATDPGQRLDEIQMWARPWIGHVAGGRVVEMVEGWTTYGPDRDLQEYAVFARVES